MEYPFKDLQPLDEVLEREGYYKDWTHIDADTFHQISELVKFIREKGYGADTREAIAQALERVYHDAAMSGNANMEVSMARKHFKDLASRLGASDDKLNSATAQLAQKATKGEIGISDLDKNKTKFDETWMTDEFKQQMAGDTPIHSELADFGVTTRKLAQKAVTPITTSFIERSSNLFDMNRLVKGNLVNGEYQPAETWSYTPEYEPISPNTPYHLSANSGQVRAYFYNKNYEHVGMIEATRDNQSVHTEGGANFAFVRFSVQHLITVMDTVQLNEGTVPLPYEPYYLRLSNEILLPGMVRVGTKLKGD